MNNNVRNDRISKALRDGKEKEELTVAIIQYNKAFNKLSDDIKRAMAMSRVGNERFASQRSLQSRVRLVERVLSSTLKFIDQNKLQFHMIDDNSLGDGDK